MTASTTCHRKSESLRVASSAENCTSSVYSRARRTAVIAALEALLARHAELALQVQVGGRDEDVDAARAAPARAPSRPGRCPSAWQRASAAMTGPRICVRDHADGLGVGLGGDREPGFDDVDAQASSCRASWSFSSIASRSRAPARRPAASYRR